MSKFVVKVGSSLVTNNGDCVDTEVVSRWAKQISRLTLTHPERHEIILVTSGAVAEGFRILRLNNTERLDISKKRAAAAVGQMELMRVYETIFSQYGLGLSQFLVTKHNLDHITQRTNLRRCLLHTLRLGRVPVFNENDAVSDESNTLGNNDILGALIARLIGASAYIILTDCNGVYDADPRKNPEAQVIHAVDAGHMDTLFTVAGGSGGKLSKGGMITKIEAAQLCVENGIDVYIANGRAEGVMENIVAGKNPGTRISAVKRRTEKEYFLDEYFSCGTLWVSHNSEKYAVSEKWDLLPAGVIRCEGEFLSGDTVCIRTEKTDQVIAYGIVNYDSDDLRRVKGMKKEHVLQILPDREKATSSNLSKNSRTKRLEVISRNNKKVVTYSDSQ